jgi:hypothetical protein
MQTSRTSRKYRIAVSNPILLTRSECREGCGRLGATRRSSCIPNPGARYRQLRASLWVQRRPALRRRTSLSGRSIPGTGKRPLRRQAPTRPFLFLLLPSGARLLDALGVPIALRPGLVRLCQAIVISPMVAAGHLFPRSCLGFARLGGFDLVLPAGLRGLGRNQFRCPMVSDVPSPPSAGRAAPHGTAPGPGRSSRKPGMRTSRARSGSPSTARETTSSVSVMSSPSFESFVGDSVTEARGSADRGQKKFPRSWSLRSKENWHGAGQHLALGLFAADQDQTRFALPRHPGRTQAEDR